MVEEDRILAGFEVETRLSMGSEHLLLLFARSRLILVHAAKVGREKMALSNTLGMLAGGLGRGKKARPLMERIVGMNTDSILALDRENFAVPYSGVVSLTVKPGSYNLAELTLLTGDMKVVMSATRGVVDAVRELMLEAMGGKVSFETRGLGT
jgi:hypothetical protein